MCLSGSLLVVGSVCVVKSIIVCANDMLFMGSSQPKTEFSRETKAGPVLEGGGLL